MHPSATAATTLLAASLLCACQTALLKRADRDRICHVVVEAAPGSVAVKANPLGDPVGGPVLGTGTAAIAAVAAILNPLYAIYVPVLIAHGAACGAGSALHPNADADFRRIFATADVGLIAGGLNAEINAPRQGCPPPPEGAATAARPDAMITLESVEAVPGCAYGDWTYVVSVTWHATRADGSELVAPRKLSCLESTLREVDAWFADPAQARAEVEQVFTATGRRIGSDLLSDEKPDVCSFYSLKGTVMTR
jgi:hypothetical protein